MSIAPRMRKSHWQPKLRTEAEFNPFASLVEHLGELEPRVLAEEAAEELAAARRREDEGAAAIRPG